MEEIKKAPQTKVFVIGTIFTPKIAQKCKKMANRKFTPPVGGTEIVFNLGIPRPGDYRKSPQPGGIYHLLHL